MRSYRCVWGCLLVLASTSVLFAFDEPYPYFQCTFVGVTCRTVADCTPGDYYCEDFAPDGICGTVNPTMECRLDLAYPCGRQRNCGDGTFRLSNGQQLWCASITSCTDGPMDPGGGGD
jgi:hypothetical protein